MTTADLLDLYRRRAHATAIAEHTDTADLVDPHGDQARGIDPDAAHDERTRLDH